MSEIYTTTCECTPCRECEGEGEFVYSAPRGPRGSFGTSEVVIVCKACKGTGKDSGDCEVHCAQPVDDPGGAFRFKITAEDLGICEACENGQHELPRIMAKSCTCACHGEQRRAA